MIGVCDSPRLKLWVVGALPSWCGSIRCSVFDIFIRDVVVWVGQSHTTKVVGCDRTAVLGVALFGVRVIDYSPSGVFSFSILTSVPAE